MSERFEELCDYWANGTLDGADFSELQERLRESPERRSEFVRRANLDSALRDFGAAELVSAKEISFSSAESNSRRVVPFRPWAIAATIAFFAAISWILIGPKFPGDAEYAEMPERSTEPIAILTGQTGTIWGDAGNSAPREGKSLGAGRLVLKEGLAQIEFFGGASVSLSGPAEIELVSPDSAVLLRGRIKADVPPAARGFEIRTADVLLEDLGTSFGLAVGDEGGADLVVFDGEVRATDESGDPVLLLGGESGRFERGTAMKASEVAADSFPDISDVFAGVGTRDASRFSEWTEASLNLRRDPRLVAYYDFQNLTVESRRLRNRAIGDTPSELDGGIVGARVAEGRWPGKTSLDFRREGDRVRFDIPGEFDQLTLMAWVRIDALDRHLNSLFLTDYYDEREIHWQISRKGALHFACSPKGVEDLEKHNRRFYSENFWDPGQSGRWFFLATTVEGGEGKTTHYIDGEAVGFSGGTHMDKPLPRMRIGEADLGNWSNPIWPEREMRTLNGRIDEFAIFSAALSAEEIRTLYENGKP